MDFVVDTHTHTLASGHAYSTLLENAAAAERKGLALFCNTDHGPSIPSAPYYWYFTNQRVIPRFLSNVGVIRGIEANILDTQGNIDLPLEADSYLDWLMAGFHEPVISPTNSVDHTLALENLITSGRVDAISHLGNPRFPHDIEAILHCAKKHNVAIELNNSSLIGESRVGSEANCDTIARLGSEIGVYFTTGSDAHFCADIGKLDHSAALLNKYHVPPEKVITSSASRFLNFLRLSVKAPIPEFHELY